MFICIDIKQLLYLLLNNLLLIVTLLPWTKKIMHRQSSHTKTKYYLEITAKNYFKLSFTSNRFQPIIPVTEPNYI